VGLSKIKLNQHLNNLNILKKENLAFLVLGFLHSVRGEFTNVSETVVGPIFTGHESECE
jgi:hypothetical protein